MTYISRRTRIIVSRWTDECDADYILRAVRKRSDGRFKRHSSCDDLRAWVNDYCIKHEYLVDLMSDGEFSARPPFRLYGRFIPVPILFKLTKGLQNNDSVNSGDTGDKREQNEAVKRLVCKSAIDKCTCISSSDFLNKHGNFNLERSASLSRIQWEKNQLEKNLYASTGLLGRALRTLKKIDTIVDLIKDESENARNEEIQLAFYESQVVCECNPFGEGKDSNVSDNLSSSRSYIKRIQDSTKCAQLLRKISDLREELKKVQECRQSIMRQIHISQVRSAKCESSNQVTELFSFREQSHVKKLKKKLAKLTSERGRLLSEMCNTLNNLNTFKRSSRLSLPRRSSRVSRNTDGFKCGLGESASCACGCNCSKESSEADKFVSDSTESYCIECGNNSNQMGPYGNFENSAGSFPPEIQPPRTVYFNRRSRSSGVTYRDDESSTLPCYYEEPKRSSSPYQRNTVDPCFINSQTAGPKGMTSRQPKCTLKTKVPNSPHEKAKEMKGSKRQSKVSFADEDESPCRKKYYQDDLSAFEKSLTSQQQAVIQQALRKIESRRSQLFTSQENLKRPTSSPTTKRERNSISAERCRNEGYERRVKSETNMQEIEKTLRNYEQRLRNYDALEYKIEEIRQKISEANRMKRELAKQREEGQREIEAEREKSCKEIMKLSSENRILKKQVQHLSAKFDASCKKIQCLNTTAQKNYELECEAKELKQELCKYRDTFEHQRKCITKLKSVVALQRTEIENLMNHIRRLTTANDFSVECPSPERKNIQRSRSYSPEILKPMKLINSSKTYEKAYTVPSEEEDGPCYCEEYEQVENMSRKQQESFGGVCYSPYPDRRKNW